MEHRVLSNRYRLEEFLGGGGMADVYRATDILLNRPVAVKILHAQFKNDKEFISKFHHEAQAAARLSHANIVNIFDVGIMGDAHYIVMEYVPGCTLKEKIKREGKLPVNTALQIAIDIAKALAHAHENGLVHCDVKPHNILMTTDGTAKIADFGIASAVTESTMTYTGNVVGSVHYFSPEQAKGAHITPKSDVYSLGVVLFEMLTGELPFRGDTPVSIAMKHINDEPPALRSLNTNIPPLVESVVMRMMSKNPDDRPTAADLVQELTEALQLTSDSNSSSDPFATQILPRSMMQNDRESLPPHTANDTHAYKEDSSILKSKKFIVGLAVVLFMGFFVGTFLSFGKFWSTAEIDMPDVTGKQMALAKQILEDKKLRVEVVDDFSDTVPPGEVISQDPAAGSKVKEERKVTITVSKGGEDVEMPDITGIKRSEAEAKLAKMGLKLGTVYEKNSDDDAGTVISQDIKAGTKIGKGRSIDITISKGKKERKIISPDVTGISQDAASSKIANSGLNVAIQTEESKQMKGTVIRQSPSAGTELNEGDTVTLFIATNNNPTSNTPTKTKTTPKETTTVPVKQGETTKGQ